MQHQLFKYIVEEVHKISEVSETRGFYTTEVSEPQAAHVTSPMFSRRTSLHKNNLIYIWKAYAKN